MALPIESSFAEDARRSLEPWIWPVTAAIVVGGILLLACGAGLFWLATHPAPQATVIWMTSPTAQSTIADQTGATAPSIAWENRSDAHAN
jgi:hypothetical protein